MSYKLFEYSLSILDKGGVRTSSKTFLKQNIILTKTKKQFLNLSKLAKTWNNSCLNHGGVKAVAKTYPCNIRYSMVHKVQDIVTDFENFIKKEPEQNFESEKARESEREDKYY